MSFWVFLVVNHTAAAAAKSLQSCPTLCDPIDGSPPGSPRPWDSLGKNTGVSCHFLLHQSKSELPHTWVLTDWNMCRLGLCLEVFSKTSISLSVVIVPSLLV